MTTFGFGYFGLRLKLLGFLRRNLRRCLAKLKETAYITLVRSTFEYAAPVWDPWTIQAVAKDISVWVVRPRRLVTLALKRAA